MRTVWTLDPASGFVVVDVAEFNSDGTSDLLIHNLVTGVTGIAFLDGATLLSAALVTTIDIAGGETLINAGFYNNDNFSDLLIHNTVTGAVSVLLLVDGVVQSQPLVTNLNFAAGFTLHSGKP